MDWRCGRGRWTRRARLRKPPATLPTRYVNAIGPPFIRVYMYIYSVCMRSFYPYIYACVYIYVSIRKVCGRYWASFYTCVYVYMYVSMRSFYTYIYICIYVYLYARYVDAIWRPFIRICIYVYIYIYMYVCIRLGVYMNIYIYVYIYIPVCIRLRMRTLFGLLLYVYIYVCVCIRLRPRPNTPHPTASVQYTWTSFAVCIGLFCVITRPLLLYT